MGLHPLLVRRTSTSTPASPHLPCRAPGDDRCPHVVDPARIGCAADGAPHCNCLRRGIRPPRRGSSRTLRSRPGRSAGRPPAAPPSRHRLSLTRHARRRVAPDGLVIPAPFQSRGGCSDTALRHAEGAPAAAGAQPQDYGELVGDVLAFLSGTYRSVDGERAHVVPGRERHSRSGSWAAAVVRARRWPAATDFGSRPTTTWRRPGPRRGGGVPRSVHAVGRGEPTVRQRVRRCRRRRRRGRRLVNSRPDTDCGCGASAPPKGPSTVPDAGRGPPANVERVRSRPRRGRLATQFVGTAGQVADGLERLRDATSADELVITTITHRHRDRLRSYELLAEEWGRR